MKTFNIGDRVKPKKPKFTVGDVGTVTHVYKINEHGLQPIEVQWDNVPEEWPYTHGGNKKSVPYAHELKLNLERG